MTPASLSPVWIEHTNMQRPETYGGTHLAYLSRYLDPQDPYYHMSADELLEAYLPHLQRMFRDLSAGGCGRCGRGASATPSP